jgi:hypothetical protein
MNILKTLTITKLEFTIWNCVIFFVSGFLAGGSLTLLLLAKETELRISSALTIVVAVFVSFATIKRGKLSQQKNGHLPKKARFLQENNIN